MGHFDEMAEDQVGFARKIVAANAIDATDAANLMMALWHSDHSPQAGLRKWVAPPPMLRYRLKRQTQAPGGEKTS